MDAKKVIDILNILNLEQQDPLYCTEEEQNIAIQLAVEAIKVLAGECDYCTNMRSLFYVKYGVIEEVYIEPDKTMTVSSACEGEGVSIEISFCPRCGAKLFEI